MALEIDLNEKIAETIVEKAVQKGIPLYGIPGNLDMLHKRLDLLQHFHCFICNDIEAHQLTKIALESEEDIKKVAKSLTSSGLKQVVITLGEKGELLLRRII